MIESMSSLKVMGMWWVSFMHLLFVATILKGIGATKKLFFSNHHQNLTEEVHKHSSALF